MSVPDFLVIHAVVAEIFQFELKWCHAAGMTKNPSPNTQYRQSPSIRKRNLRMKMI